MRGSSRVEHDLAEQNVLECQNSLRIVYGLKTLKCLIEIRVSCFEILHGEYLCVCVCV